MTKELAIKNAGIKAYDAGKIEEVTKMAVALKNYVVQQQLFVGIQGHNYAFVEGWQVAGGMLGLSPKVASVENLSSTGEIKWKATVELIDKQGIIVGNGFALCSSKESKKKNFDEYAILSMSQTRAIGKAYRNKIGWVMKLAGYQATPAEEMTKVGDEVVATVQVEPVATASKKPFKYYSDSGIEISKAEHDYSVKVYGLPLSRAEQKSGKFRTKSRK